MVRQRDVIIRIDQKELKALDRRLAKLTNRLRDKVLASAVRFGLKPFIQEARKRAPRETGQLRKSLGTRIKKYKRDDVVFGVAGPRRNFKDPVTGRNPANYAHLVEFGTSPHPIPAGTGLVILGAVIRGTVQHPGARQKPFMRPAFKIGKRKALKKYSERLAKGLRAEVRKLARAG